MKEQPRLRNMQAVSEAVELLRPDRDGLYAKQQLFMVAHYVGKNLDSLGCTLNEASIELTKEARRSGFKGDNLERDIDSAVIGGEAEYDHELFNEACEFVHSKMTCYEYFDQMLDTVRHLPKWAWDQPDNVLEGLAHYAGSRSKDWDLSVEQMRAALIEAAEHAGRDMNEAINEIEKGLRDGLETMRSYIEYHNSLPDPEYWNDTSV
jgi:hypothetical protein